MKTRPGWAWPLAIFTTVFGVISITAGTTILFVGGPARELAGDYVPFVVWFNFLAGFAYIAAAMGLALWRPWVAPLALAIALLTGAVLIALGGHILMGGGYEIRTIGALLLRMLIWLGIAYAVRR